MSNRDTPAPRSTASQVAEDPERLLLRSLKNVYSNLEVGRVEKGAQKHGLLPMGDKTERDAPFRIIAGQAASEEPLTNTKLFSVTPQTSEHHLVCNGVAGTPVHVEDLFSKPIPETLTSNQKGMDNRVSTALGTLLLYTVWKAINLPDFLPQFLEAVIDSPVFINPVAVLVRSEAQELATEQARIEDSCRQFVEAGMKIDSWPALVTSEGSYRPRSDKYDDKTNSRAYSIQWPQVEYKN